LNAATAKKLVVGRSWVQIEALPASMHACGDAADRPAVTGHRARGTC